MEEYKNKLQGLLEELPAKLDYLQELKSCFLVNLFNVSVASDDCPVRQPFVTNLSAVEMKLTEIQEYLWIFF